MSKHDGFLSAFGRGRGPLQVDTVLSVRPSPEAHQDAQRHLDQLREGRYDETLALLREHRPKLRERPLLRKLAGAVVYRLVADCAASVDPGLRAGLDAGGIYTAESDYLLFASQAPDGQRKRTTLHIWPEGNQVGPLACLQREAHTVCGLPVKPHALTRAKRGLWASENLAERGWVRCPECEAGCPEQLKWVLEETAQYVPFGAEGYGALLKAVRKVAVKALADSDFSGLDDARALCAKAYLSCLLPLAGKHVRDHEEVVLQQLLGAREWQGLTRLRGRPLAGLLDGPTLKGWVLACLPTADGASPDPERAAAAREAVRQMLRRQVEESSVLTTGAQ